MWDSLALRLVIAATGGYLLGSIPVGLILGMKLKKVDVREYGSGNIGATNVLRVLGPIPGLLVLAMDLAKGGVSAWAGLRLGGPWGGSVGAMAAILGHSFPVWLNFRGGKSVATAGGALLVLAPVVLLVEVTVFVVMVAATRYVSLGSITVAAAAPFVCLALARGPATVAFAAAAGSLILWRHKLNVQRLLQGKESRLGHKTPPGNPRGGRDGKLD